MIILARDPSPSPSACVAEACVERKFAMATTDTSQREGLHPRGNRLAGRLLPFLINRVNVFTDGRNARGRLPSTKVKLNREQGLFTKGRDKICIK